MSRGKKDTRLNLNDFLPPVVRVFDSVMTVEARPGVRGRGTGEARLMIGTDFGCN